MSYTPATISLKNLVKNKIAIIDGFRGLAIILVICYHYFSFVSFGWIGVDLFFVLSGFLITGKLIESLGKKNYFFSFYLNRILRIVPIYYLTLIGCFFILPLVLPSVISSSINELLKNQFYYWTFSVNYYDALYGWPDNVTLVPMWSLSCEMQFYLVWPFIILLIGKLNKKMIFFILIGFILFAILYRLYGNYADQFSIAYRYVLLPSRLDAFSFGAILYILYSDNQFARILSAAWILAATSFLLIIFMMIYQQRLWQLDATVTSKFGYTLTGIFWTSVIGFVLTTNNFLRKIFTSKWLMNAGKYSYAMYIIHVPIKIIILKAFGNPALNSSSYFFSILIAILLTIILSMISYHLIEKKFLKYKR